MGTMMRSPRNISGLDWYGSPRNRNFWKRQAKLEAEQELSDLDLTRRAVRQVEAEESDVWVL